MVTITEGFLDWMFDELVKNNPHRFFSIFKKKPHFSYLILQNGIPVGMILLKRLSDMYYKENDALSCQIGLLQPYKRQGIGYVALKALRTYHVYTKLYCLLESTDIPVFRLLQKLQGGMHIKKLIDGYLYYKVFFHVDKPVKYKYRDSVALKLRNAHYFLIKEKERIKEIIKQYMNQNL